MLDLPGFPNPKAAEDADKDLDENFKKKHSKKTGGFQSMNLSFNVLKGVMKRGYKIPTPIQRKVLFQIFNNIYFIKFNEILDHTNHHGR